MHDFHHDLNMYLIAPQHMFAMQRDFTISLNACIHIRILSPLEFSVISIHLKINFTPHSLWFCGSQQQYILGHFLSSLIPIALMISSSNIRSFGLNVTSCKSSSFVSLSVSKQQQKPSDNNRIMVLTLYSYNSSLTQLHQGFCLLMQQKKHTGCHTLQTNADVLLFLRSLST